MKKLLLGIVSTSFFIAVNAQISFGPKAGLNISIVRFNSPNLKSDPLVPGFYGGAFFNYKFSNHFAAQTELFYSGEGAKYKIKGSPTVYAVSNSYLNFPVLFQYVAGGLYLETGPQIGFLLSAKESANGNTENIKSDINSTKFSWCFGLGIRIAKEVGIGARYAAGFSNINKNSDGTIKGSVLSIGLSYAFHAKNK